MTYTQGVKHIRASFAAWDKLKTASDNENTYIRCVLDEILTGRRNPVTMEPLTYKEQMFKKGHYEKRDQ